jgi:hypothetical protein
MNNQLKIEEAQDKIVSLQKLMKTDEAQSFYAWSQIGSLNKLIFLYHASDLRSVALNLSFSKQQNRQF